MITMMQYQNDHNDQYDNNDHNKCNIKMIDQWLYWYIDR